MAKNALRYPAFAEVAEAGQSAKFAVVPGWGDRLWSGEACYFEPLEKVIITVFGSTGGALIVPSGD